MGTVLSTLEILLILVIILLISILPIIALIDVLKNRFGENQKLIWVLVILLSGLIGAIIYYFIGRKQKL